MTTKLAAITNNSLALSCKLCGHAQTLHVARFMAVFSPDTTVDAAASQARCSRCQVKGQVGYRIIYEGGSFEALQGTRR